MLTDWPINGNWEELCRQWHQELNVSCTIDSLWFSGSISFAIIEVMHTLSKKFSHRRKLIVVKDQDPALEKSIIMLAKEGIKLEFISRADLSNHEMIASKIDSETLAVLYFIDDGFLGLIENDEGLVDECAKKRVFCVRGIHTTYSSQFDLNQSLNPYEIRIFSLNSNFAGIQCGERSKITPLFTPTIKWNELDLKKCWLSFLNKSDSHKDFIQSFESSDLLGGEPLLKSNQNRIWDRICIGWKDMDGHSIAFYLAKQFQLELSETGNESPIETLSLSRWGGMRTMDWAKSLGLSSELIRGSLIISSELFSEELLNKLHLAIQTVRKLQSGS